MQTNHQENAPLAPEFVARLTGVQLDLYAFICMLLGNRQDAPDVLQETNMMLTRHAATYDPTRPFLPWARAFAYNQVRACIKRASRNRLVFDDDLVASMADERTAMTDESGAELAFLEACLQELAPEQKALIEARYFHNENMQSLAARLRRSKDTLYVQLHRIRARLGRCIEFKMHIAVAQGGRT